MLSLAGLEPHTLLVLASDNGGAQMFGASNYPLRGTKGSLWEARGHPIMPHVPLIACAPKQRAPLITRL